MACPCYGSIAKHYFIQTRRHWRCRDCKHALSVTSGTIFAFHKLPLWTYGIAIGIVTAVAKGISALQLGRDLDVQYKTAFVLAQKFLESLMEHRDESVLAGEGHMDEVYVNGHVHLKNKKADRIGHRLAVNQRPDKRCMFAMRQKVEMESNKIQGTNKTLSFVIKAENQADVSKLAAANLGATQTDACRHERATFHCQLL